jgi:hypothetical protein
MKQQFADRHIAPHEELEDRWQKVYKLLKERFPVKYTIISTVLISKCNFKDRESKMNYLFQLWNSNDTRIPDTGVSEWLLPNANSFSATSWREQLNFQWNDDKVSFRWQKVYKLLKERFPVKYTIISTVLISKPPPFMCKAKVSSHVFVCEVFRFCLLLLWQCFFLFFLHLIK